LPTFSSTTSDPDTTNNSANEATTVATSADVSITKSDSPDPVTAGTDLTYTLTVKNAGPSFARSVQATDPVPAGTSFVSADSGGLNVAGTVTWNLGDLPRSAEHTHVIQKRSAIVSRPLSNNENVSSTTSDPDGT